jgi:hypothetical protein
MEAYLVICATIAVPLSLLYSLYRKKAIILTPF